MLLALLTHFVIRLKESARDKHSSLYFGSVSDEEKSLITLTTGVSVVALFSSSLKLQQSKLVFTWQAF